MLIGAIGHIDHGKTTLVKALTGVDADRLPEEKARGITLDLGYAYLPTATGAVLGFIDMPGHERLIHNMLAGATGIDFVLLVVAADDGVMPQTREHLAVADLLNLARGAVALTKVDAVDAARREEVAQDIGRLLRGTALAGCPLFPLSAVTGEGVAALSAHLSAAAAAHQARSVSGGFRLAIDRCFTLAGIGTVVTGTALSGQVAVGDKLCIAPGKQQDHYTARVKSLHVQDRQAQRGAAGERCALALAGDFEKAAITRGMWLVAPHLTQPLTRFHAEIRVPAEGVAGAELRHWSAVHVHLGADDIPGRLALLDGEKVAAGQTALAEILLERATLACFGDRFILRDAAALCTLAGGRVLDCAPPTRRKRTPERLALLRGLCVGAADPAQPAEALALLCARAPAGFALTRFAQAWNLDAATLERCVQQLGLHTLMDGETQLGFLPAAWQALQARLLDTLAHEHERAPDMPGVERERLRRMSLATLPRAAFDALTGELLRQGALMQSRAWLHLPGHQASIAQADKDFHARIQALLEAAPCNPPRVRDIARLIGMDEDAVRHGCQRLARAGELYQVAHDHFFSAAAVSSLAEFVASACAARGVVRAAELRDHCATAGGGGRKVAIQILEFFDRVGYTRRVRDEHALRQHPRPLQW